MSQAYILAIRFVPALLYLRPLHQLQATIRCGKSQKIGAESPGIGVFVVPDIEIGFYHKIKSAQNQNEYQNIDDFGLFLFGFLLQLLHRAFVPQDGSALGQGGTHGQDALADTLQARHGVKVRVEQAES